MALLSPVRGRGNEGLHTAHGLAIPNCRLEQLLKLGLVLRRDEGQTDIGDFAAGGLGRRRRSGTGCITERVGDLG